MINPENHSSRTNERSMAKDEIIPSVDTLARHANKRVVASSSVYGEAISEKSPCIDCAHLAQSRSGDSICLLEYNPDTIAGATEWPYAHYDPFNEWELYEYCALHVPMHSTETNFID